MELDAATRHFTLTTRVGSEEGPFQKADKLNHEQHITLSEATLCTGMSRTHGCTNGYNTANIKMHSTPREKERL
jgi:hypothetical protein